MLGYLRLTARYGGRCSACDGTIQKGDWCWWQKTLRYLRCWECPPDEDVRKFDELVIWYIEEGQFEEDDEYEGFDEWGVGVIWLDGDSDEHEEEEVGDRGQSGREGDTSFLLPVLRTDATPARKLTSLDEVLARPFELLVDELTPTLDFHISQSHRRSAGRFEREELRAVAYLKFVETLDKFEGRGSFGAYIDAVIPRALTDHARRELRHDRNVSLDDEKHSVVLAHDPTDDWIETMDVRAGLDAVPNSGLLLLKDAGFRSHELGVASVIDMRASRAREALAEWLWSNGLMQSILASRKKGQAAHAQ